MSRGKTMRYETPQMTTLTPVINAIQSTIDFPRGKTPTGVLETPYDLREMIGAYADWE
jgi:hypothetical protein